MQTTYAPIFFGSKISCLRAISFGQRYCLAAVCHDDTAIDVLRACLVQHEYLISFASGGCPGAMTSARGLILAA